MMIPNNPVHPRLSLCQASKLLSSFQVKSTKLADQCYERALYGEEKLSLNTFSQLLAKDEILRQAQASDDRTRQNQRLSPLDGIPVTIKANIAVKGHRNTAGSKILGECVVSEEKYHKCGMDAYVVQRLLRELGAVLIGITNMDEFGMGSLGTNVAESNRIPRNPLPFLQAEEKGLLKGDIKTEYPHLSTGGSSSGAASSISFGSSILSIGTDTGGSVRLPAAWNGVVGFKPTYGWMSRHGVVEYASSLDTIGIIAPTVHCAHLAMNSLLPKISNDKNYQSAVGDVTAVKRKRLPPLTKEPDLNRMRIGIPSSFCISEIPPFMIDAWEASASYLHEKCNADIVVLDDNAISKKWIKQSLAAYYVLACAEASSNLARYDGVRYGIDSEIPINSNSMQFSSTLEKQYGIYRSLNFGNEVKRRILCGNTVLSSDRYHTFYESAAKIRAALSQQFKAVFQGEVDVILVPTSITLPWNLDQVFGSSLGTKMYENDIMTVPISLSSLPSVSVPITGFGEGIQVVGMQFFGPQLGEESVLRAAKSLETINNHKIT